MSAIVIGCAKTAKSRGNVTTDHGGAQYCFDTVCFRLFWRALLHHSLDKELFESEALSPFYKQHLITFNALLLRWPIQVKHNTLIKNTIHYRKHNSFIENTIHLSKTQYIYRKHNTFTENTINLSKTRFSFDKCIVFSINVLCFQ